jgi:hypothetical protein
MQAQAQGPSVAVLQRAQAAAQRTAPPPASRRCAVDTPAHAAAHAPGRWRTQRPNPERAVSRLLPSNRKRQQKRTLSKPAMLRFSAKNSAGVLLCSRASPIARGARFHAARLLTGAFSRWRRRRRGAAAHRMPCVAGVHASQ